MLLPGDQRWKGVFQHDPLLPRHSSFFPGLKIILFPVQDHGSTGPFRKQHFAPLGRADPFSLPASCTGLIQKIADPPVSHSFQGIAAGQPEKSRLLLIWHITIPCHLIKSEHFPGDIKPLPLFLSSSVGAFHFLGQLLTELLRQNGFNAGKQGVLREIKLLLQI